MTDGASTTSTLPADASDRLLSDVSALASMDRRTTSAGERRSAEWIERRLNEIGAADIVISDYRSQSSWAPVHLMHVLAAAGAGFVPGWAGRLVGAAAASSYELEVSGRSQWMRRILPAKRGVSVTARIPANGEVRRTVVLVAHHDAAHNGMVWHPRTIALNRWWSKRTGESMPIHAPVLAAMAATAIPANPLRRAGMAVLGVAALAMVQSMRSYTTPGANDNATGVAAILELAARIQANPLPETEVLLVFPGGEEAGNVGMRAWVRSSHKKLTPNRTLVVNLDSLGSGGHLVVARREGLTGRLADADVKFATDTAASAGIPLHTISFPNVCDATMARHKGMHAISLLSYEAGWIRHLHLKSDTVAEVRWNTVDDAITLTQQLALAWSATP